MTTLIAKRQSLKTEDIPEILVYEELNGRKLYRKGYEKYLNQTKTIEEITGRSSLQGIVISILLRYLYKNTDENEYEIITNEIGLHVSLGNNLNLFSQIKPPQIRPSKKQPQPNGCFLRF